MLPHERGEIYVTPDTTKSQLSDEDEEHDDAETVQQPRGWTACTVILCLFHVALGIGCIALQICSMVTKSRAANVSSGVWCGVMYIATGIAGIIALIPFSMKVLRIFKIMNIVNLVLVPLMWGCVIASMVLDHIHQRYHPDRWKWNLFNGLLLGAGAMELLMAALSLVMCCRAGLLCLGQQCCIDEDEEEEDENQQY